MGRGHVFRPYRDIRFSTDKSPYKTNIAPRLGDGYVACDEGLGVGVGMWHMMPDQLERYRAAVDEDRWAGGFERIVAERRAGLTAEGHGS